MKSRHSKKYYALCLLLLAASVSEFTGCAAAVVGVAAGAGGGIAFSDRGAKSEVKGTVQEVDVRARDVLKNMNIQVTESSTKDLGKEKDISGKSGKADVNVEMTSTGPNLTHVEVIVREELLKWNKDYAKDILSKIVAHG